MLDIFLYIVNTGISASWAVLAVILLRFLLKKTSRQLLCLLWCVVAIRLICPVSFASVFSLIPSAKTISSDITTTQYPRIDTGITVLDESLNPVIGKTFAPSIGSDVNPMEMFVFVFAVVWLIGLMLLLAYAVITGLRLSKKVETAVLLRDNIYQSERVISPFVFGIYKPRIYLPYRIMDQDAEYVIAHELAHIRRKDYLWKPFGFFLLAFYWFHPLMWIGYILYCRDMELACDEKVVQSLDRNSRAKYSQALLNCSVNKPIPVVCPLAFAEVRVKERVKAVLKYKKPALGLMIVAIVLCVLVSFCLLTNPINSENSGIKSISVADFRSDVVSLKIKYAYPSGGYQVRMVPEDEGEYCGDGIVDYDGSLGKYRIMIEFGDIGPTQEFMERYSAGEVTELENAPIKIRMKRVHPQDHGCVLYLGFDNPVHIVDVSPDKLNGFGGNINLKIGLDCKIG